MTTYRAGATRRPTKPEQHDMTITFEIATAQRDTLDAALSNAIAALNALATELAGDAPRIMGLTPDHVKANPDWQRAKAAADRAFQSLRQFNGVYVRQFKRELAAARHAARNRAILDL